MRNNIVGIIQARMGSSRLPGKVLARKINGKPMLWHILHRVLLAKSLNKTAIATSTSRNDDEIERFAVRNGFDLFRGSEEDCLDRYYNAAKKYNASTIVRITGDCPLICPEIIDKVVYEFLGGCFDYVSNTLIYTYPDGCDVEVFSFDALEKAWKECNDSLGREHVTPYLRNSNIFRIKNVNNENPVDPNEFKWSVDRIEDLNFVSRVYEHLGRNNNYFDYFDIMSFMQNNPEINKMNKNFVTNEGYYRSLLDMPAIKPKKLILNESLNLKKRAEKIIPDCSQTFSKGPSQFVQGASPVFLERGNGCNVWDVDGNKFIDYSMALGPVILGYGYPAVVEAVKKQLKSGSIFSLPHKLEVELSELLCEIIPCAEMVRFGKNGSDATSGAIRLARGYTGRDKIACSGYHGWQDWYIGTTTRNKGVPQAVRELTPTFEYNNIKSLEKIFEDNRNEIAAVILEPVSVDQPENNFLNEVQKLAHKNGSLLIFDEVITGFRMSLGGAQEYFGILPDLACFGKAMGNGFPVSAIVGKKEIMKLFDKIFFSFTFGGETISLAAAIATINELREKQVLSHIGEQGRKLIDGYNIFAEYYGLNNITGCKGFPSRSVIMFNTGNDSKDLLLKSIFQQECIDRGVFFTGAHNISFSHNEKDVTDTLKVYRSALEIVKDAIDGGNLSAALNGEPVQPVFRKI